MNTLHSASGLRKDAIDLALDAQSHVGILRRLGVLSAMFSEYVDPTEAMTAFMARERLGSIVLAEQVALPHSPFSGIYKPIVSVVRSTKPVEFDEGSVSLAIGILVPRERPRQHLEILRFWASLLGRDECRQALLSAPTNERFDEVVKAYACSL